MDGERERWMGRGRHRWVERWIGKGSERDG